MERLLGSYEKEKKWFFQIEGDSRENIQQKDILLPSHGLQFNSDTNHAELVRLHRFKNTVHALTSVAQLVEGGPM